MKTTIVCGLLGSGKTTFIQHFLRETTEKAVVLVNDFGKAGIDGEIFSAGDIESIELPSGCVCCTLKFDLITTLKKITETLSPEHLVIEPSGVASPSAVLEVLELIGMPPAAVIGVVDAAEFAELHEAEMYGRFFEDQIVNSDILLVNKTDLADEAATAKTVAILEEMNPRAILFRTVNAVIPGPLPEISDAVRQVRGSVHPFQFEAVSLRPGNNLDFAAVSSFFDEMSAGRYGDIVRAKALVNTVQGPFRLDLSFANVQGVPFEKEVTESRIVVIGNSLKKDALGRALS